MAPKKYRKVDQNIQCKLPKVCLRKKLPKPSRWLTARLKLTGGQYAHTSRLCSRSDFQNDSHDCHLFVITPLVRVATNTGHIKIKFA